MIAMLDTHQDLSVCSAELGCKVEQLFTPLTRRNVQDPDRRFAMDNGAFSSFSADAFWKMLEKHLSRRNLCRFVAVPDVPGSAIRTLECFEAWRYRLSGWPLALVCQDGQELFPIPWPHITAVFIGGTTEWKMGRHAEHIIKAAHVCGAWCHVGRVNTPGRFEYFDRLGADSIDGSGLGMYSHMREAIAKKLRMPTLGIAE